MISVQFSRCRLKVQETEAVMLRVDADNIVIDNSWLWRADHVESGQLVQGQNPCQAAVCWTAGLSTLSSCDQFKCLMQVGAVINGNNVVAYGFKAEHALTDQVKVFNFFSLVSSSRKWLCYFQVQWNGQGGHTFMFQAAAWLVT